MYVCGVFVKGSIPFINLTLVIILKLFKNIYI